ncbi:MAG: TetR family transcriptional regulator [Kurthia sp.]|nr:TetR family transcriptional regulator [Candidatus Kurthia equi]
MNKLTLEDPRAIRTRKLLVDAFQQLIRIKNFEQITVKDITELATVNRATFYAHFVDKFEMLDEVLGQQLKEIMATHFTCHSQLDEQTIQRMFCSIIDVHQQMESSCRRGYNSLHAIIEEKVKEMLIQVILPMLPADKHQKTKAMMFSWALYGAYESNPHDADSAFIAQQLKKLL